MPELEWDTVLVSSTRKEELQACPWRSLVLLTVKPLLSHSRSFLDCTRRWLCQHCDILWGSICVANQMLLKLAGKIQSHKSKGGSYLSHFLHMFVVCAQMNLSLLWGQLMHHACAKGMEPTLK